MGRVFLVHESDQEKTHVALLRDDAMCRVGSMSEGLHDECSSGVFDLEDRVVGYE